MVEPLGCVAVAETGLILAIKLGRLIKDLQAAPAELLALSNEVCNLKVVLQSVREAISGGGPKGQVLNVEPLLFQASIRFEEIDKIVSRLGQLGPYGNKWNIRTWERFVWHHEKGRIAELLWHLRDIRSNIALAFGVSCSYVPPRLCEELCPVPITQKAVMREIMCNVSLDLPQQRWL